MPPPPPPSASYLWKFDSSDEEDEGFYATSDDEERQQVHTVTPESVERSVCSPPGSEMVDVDVDVDVDVNLNLNQERIRNEDLHSSGDTLHEDDENTEQQTGSKAKRRKRKKKKKKKKKASNRKCVSFGDVHVQTFERRLGTEVVPGEGGWPLGLGSAQPALSVLQSQISVNDYEHSKQNRLLERWNKLTGAQLLHAAASPSLETRQWDYKHKVRNPLFGILNEQQRMNLLLEDSSNDHVDPAWWDRSQPENTAGGRHTGRTRSGSFAEHYNESYPQIEVHHVRNELEQIRNSRSVPAGCTCRKLQVYLLPANAGKKAHHRRMKVPKLKEELRKRHLLPETTVSREELEILLHDSVEAEPCCGNDCPCVRNGIDCQAEACTCWYDSHQTKDSQKGQETHRAELSEIVARCGNPNGMLAIDLDKIESFRRRFLKDLTVCSPVTK